MAQSPLGGNAIFHSYERVFNQDVVKNFNSAACTPLAVTGLQSTLYEDATITTDGTNVIVDGPASSGVFSLVRSDPFSALSALACSFSANVDQANVSKIETATWAWDVTNQEPQQAVTQRCAYFSAASGTIRSSDCFAKYHFACQYPTGTWGLSTSTDYSVAPSCPASFAFRTPTNYTQSLSLKSLMTASAVTNVWLNYSSLVNYSCWTNNVNPNVACLSIGTESLGVNITFAVTVPASWDQYANVAAAELATIMGIPTSRITAASRTGNLATVTVSHHTSVTDTPSVTAFGTLYSLYKAWAAGATNSLSASNIATALDKNTLPVPLSIDESVVSSASAVQVSVMIVLSLAMFVASLMI